MPPSPQLHCFRSGADNHERPAVLLIHGAGGHHLSWPPQVRRLYDQRLFAMDLPGHGRSPGIGYQRIEDYSDAVVDLMQRFHLNAAVWVGHSMGGAIALDAALRHPNSVLGLGLLGCGARLRVDPAILHAAAQEYTFQAAIKMVSERSFGESTPVRLKELATQRMAETRPSVLLGDLLACDAFDVADQLGRIDRPALILCGDEDRMTPVRYSEFLHAGIHGSTIKVVTGVGHMLMLEQPDEVADSLGQFLNTIAYRPGA